MAAQPLHDTAGDDVAAARRWVADHADRPLGNVVNVLVDGSGRVGPLSYRVPAHLTVAAGDAVEVPFGKRQAYGCVLAAGDPAKATRTIDTVFGKRVTAAELAAARLLAERHFVELGKVAARLSPTSGKGAAPASAGPVELTAEVVATVQAELGPRADDYVEVVRRFAARPPSIDPAHWAARIAADLAVDGQVLVLCPTVDLVDAVTDAFTSGARRIDSRADRGAWRGFTDGQVRIGVGTRTAALYSGAQLAAIVVVEQDHPGHVEARMPNTHARDVALVRSQVCDVPLVFTGAVPTPPALTCGVKLVETDAPWPDIDLVDRSELAAGQRMLPPTVAAAVSREVKAGRTPLVLVERPRAIHRCVRCSRRREHEGCPTAVGCDHRFDACETCGEVETRPVGWDEARIHQLFGGQVRAVSLPALATARDAGLVVVFDLDRAPQAAQLAPDVYAANVLMAAATATRADGRVLVCTDDPSRPALQALAGRRSFRDFAYVLWDQFARQQLPPFGRLVTVKVGRDKRPSVAGWPGRVLGPRRTHDGWEVLVRIDGRELPRLRPYIDRIRRPGRCRVTVS